MTTLSGTSRIWRAGLTRAKSLTGRVVASDPGTEGELLLVFKTAGAAGLAWLAGTWLTGSPNPVLASLAAVLVVQTTIFETMQNGLTRVAGVVLGVLLALALGHFLGFSAWSLTLVLLLALLVGRAFRLGGQTNQVAVSALLVLTVGGTTAGYGVTRIVDTLVGALVGVLVNVLIVPPVHVNAARESLSDLARKVGDLLVDTGHRISSQEFSPSGIRQLLWTAREYQHEVEEIQDLLDRAAESLRYNPRQHLTFSRVRKPAPRALLKRMRSGADAISHLVNHAISMIRSLVDVGEGRLGEEWESGIAARVGELVSGTGRAVETWVRSVDADEPAVAQRPGSESPRQRLVSEVDELRAQLDDLRQELDVHRQETGRVTAATWVVVGSVLADISRILIEIDPAHGSHQSALSATPPAHLHLRPLAFAQFRRGIRGMRDLLHRNGS